MATSWMTCGELPLGGRHQTEFEAHTRFNGAYSLAQAAMNVFESNGHDTQDAIAVNNYGEYRVRARYIG